MVRPMVKQRLRPQRSDNLLPGIIRAAMTNRNSVIAVCTPWTVVSRSVLMSLIITFMLEPAKLQMNWARARGTSSLRGETVVLARFRFSVMWLPPIHVQPRSGVPTSLLPEDTFMTELSRVIEVRPGCQPEHDHNSHRGHLGRAGAQRCRFIAAGQRGQRALAAPSVDQRSADAGAWPTTGSVPASSS